MLLCEIIGINPELHPTLVADTTLEVLVTIKGAKGYCSLLGYVTITWVVLVKEYSVVSHEINGGLLCHLELSGILEFYQILRENVKFSFATHFTTKIAIFQCSVISLKLFIN